MPLSVYKLLLKQLVETDFYYKLYSSYALLKFYYITFNIDWIKLCLLYKFQLVLTYYKWIYKRL